MAPARARDWAAKGTRLLGVKAVVAASFERIHRSNLVGMGVLPLQFPEGTNAQSLGLDGSETFSITGCRMQIQPGQDVTLEITRQDGEKQSVPVKLRIDTPIEIDYYRHGGILHFVLRELMAKQADVEALCRRRPLLPGAWHRRLYTNSRCDAARYWRNLRR